MKGPTWLLAVALVFRVAAGLRAANDGAIALPPFIVEESRPWVFAEVPGYEFLSRCSEATTRQIVESQVGLHRLLGEILPPHLQMTMTLPRSFILYDEELQAKSSHEVVTGLLENTLHQSRRANFLPNLRLSDRDAMVIFMLARRSGFKPEETRLTPEYVAYLLRNRRPLLPAWFYGGFMGLYNSLKFEGDRITIRPFGGADGLLLVRKKDDTKSYFIESANNQSKQSGKLISGVATPSFEELFLGQKSNSGDDDELERMRLWRARSSLFVRWGLEPARRISLWKFIERGSTEPITEKLFQECFGIDYAKAVQRVTEYSRTEVRQPIVVTLSRASRVPAIALNVATAAQVARIKGDWERLEVGYVREFFPELVPKYLAQARLTLDRGRVSESRNSQLLAVLGLCERDNGDGAAAKKFLEEAIKVGPVRPRAAFELAHYRLLEHRANPGGANGKISTAQASEVMAPLLASLAQQPPLHEVFDLIGQVWDRAESTPTREDLATLERGFALFPEKTHLLLRAAELNLRHGFRAEAAKLLTTGAQIVSDEIGQKEISQMREELERK